MTENNDQKAKNTADCVPMTCSADSWLDKMPVEAGYFWVRNGKSGEVFGVFQVESHDGELQVYHHTKWRKISDPNYWLHIQWWSKQLNPPNDES